MGGAIGSAWLSRESLAAGFAVLKLQASAGTRLVTTQPLSLHIERAGSRPVHDRPTRSSDQPVSTPMPASRSRGGLSPHPAIGPASELRSVLTAAFKQTDKPCRECKEEAPSDQASDTSLNSGASSASAQRHRINASISRLSVSCMLSLERTHSPNSDIRALD